MCETGAEWGELVGLSRAIRIRSLCSEAGPDFSLWLCPGWAYSYIQVAHLAPPLPGLMCVDNHQSHGGSASQSELY